MVEYTTNNAITRSYEVDEQGTILRVCDPDCTAPTASYLPVWNGHGDATALYRINNDGTLTLANSYTYDTWGTPTTTTHNSTADLGFRFLYVGAHDVQWDNAYGLALIYMHARHYSPFTGRFLQADPARAEPNPYAYARNCIMLIDGLSSVVSSMFVKDCRRVVRECASRRSPVRREATFHLRS